MIFLGRIRCDRDARQAFFTSDANEREYQLVYGDETSSPDPVGSAYYIVSGRNGQHVAFSGEVTDIEGDAIRIESAVHPWNDPPDLNEGLGMLGQAVAV